MDLGLIRYFLLLLLLGGCVTSSIVDESIIFGQLVGEWDTEDASTCETPRTISFSSDKKVMVFTYAELGYASETDVREQFKYDVLEVRESALRLALENEPRQDADGNPVIWILKLIDENTFCWGRDDWPASGCTPPRIRCET